MNRRHILLTCITALGAAWAGTLAPPAHAQESFTLAEVMKVDKPGMRITLKHGEIKNLDMPPMTMIFRVREVALLEGLAVGDRVSFKAQKINGSYTVTELTRK